jgi:hypothetical protein
MSNVNDWILPDVMYPCVDIEAQCAHTHTNLSYWREGVCIKPHSANILYYRGWRLVTDGSALVDCSDAEGGHVHILGPLF